MEIKTKDKKGHRIYRGHSPGSWVMTALLLQGGSPAWSTVIRRRLLREWVEALLWKYSQ
jgi:hypothetical protein